MRKGALNPTAVCPLASAFATHPAHLFAVRTHECPVANRKESRQGIEGNVVSRTFGVVVWRGELWASGVEASSADRGGKPHGCS